MRPRVTTLGLLLLGAGCSSSGNQPSIPPVAVATPGPTPTPSPTPSPSPTPGPGPTPTPTTANSYMPFSDIYVFRMGAGVTVQSGCAGFKFQGEPPALLPTTAFGSGPTFRFVLTPQVWAIGGIGSFDGRDGDPFESAYPDPVAEGIEVRYSKLFGPDPVRFTITRPTAGGTALDYARLASVWAPVDGVRGQYQCVTGIPTVAEDLIAPAPIAYRSNVLIGTAYVRDGAVVRPYSLARSVVSATADIPAGRVSYALRLVGTPIGMAGAEIVLGTVEGTAPIDRITGNFTANLSSGGRAVTGTISGRFFGPGGVEIGASVSGAAPVAAGLPDFSFAGTVYGVK